MELKRIADSRTPDAEKLIALHRETFPEYERFCDTPLMANMIDHEGSMYFNAVYEKGELAGLFVYWDLGDSYYIHFIAVYPEKRNHKIGQHILDWVCEHLHRPVFLEAEIPYDAITARRLCFWNWPKTPEPSRITAVAGIPCGSWEPGPWKTSTTT